MAKNNTLEKQVTQLSKDELVSLITILLKYSDNKIIVQNALQVQKPESPAAAYVDRIKKAVGSLKKPNPVLFPELRAIVKEFRMSVKDKNQTFILMHACLDESISYVKKQKIGNDDFLHGLADLFYQTLEYCEKGAILKKHGSEIEQLTEKAHTADSDLHDELAAIYSDYLDD